jgi:L-Ala-D/L-Glu epimerase
MKITHEPLDLPLADTFTISRESQSVAHNRLVRVAVRAGGAGMEGLGECAPHRFIGSGLERCMAALDAAAAALKDYEWGPPALEQALLIETIPDCPPARAAVEMAMLDIIGRARGMPLWRMWGIDPDASPRTSFTIGIDAPDYMVEKARRARTRGFDILKVKVGMDGDIDTCRRIIGETGCALRVDANCAWTPDEAVLKGRQLADMGVELIEQPIPPGDNAALRRVADEVSIPIIADESVLTSRDAATLAGCADGVNVKLAKCGGLIEARRVIETARARGMKVMLGCMIESSIGITAAAHLAPLVDFVDLDGNLLLAKDPFRGVTAEGDRLVLPRSPGSGVHAAIS